MSAPQLTLAQGSLTDLDAVMAVMDDSFDPSFGEAWTASQCAALLPLPGVWLTLARDADEAVGFSLARAVAGEAELLLLAVRGGRQRRGVGARLIGAFEEASKSRGATRVHLEVREGNHALGLYEQTGFLLVGRRRNYYSGARGRTYDALTLAKILHR